jgi:hypothetical protein
LRQHCKLPKNPFRAEIPPFANVHASIPRSLCYLTPINSRGSHMESPGM